MPCLVRFFVSTTLEIVFAMTSWQRVLIQSCVSVGMLSLFLLISEDGYGGPERIHNGCIVFRSEVKMSSWLYWLSLERRYFETGRGGWSVRAWFGG